jgi:hypothetical protein
MTNSSVVHQQYFLPIYGNFGGIFGEKEGHVHEELVILV